MSSRILAQRAAISISPLRAIFRGSIWFGLAVGVNRVLPGLLIVVLALWLKPNQIGAISFVLAYYALLLPLADWSISYALQKLIPERENLVKQIYWTALLMRFGISILLGLLCWALDLTVRTFHGYGAYLALLLVTSTFGTVPYVHNAIKQFSRGSLYSIGLHIGWVGLALVLVKAGLPVTGAFLALAAAFVFMGLYACLFDPFIRGGFSFLPQVALDIVHFGLWATVAIVLSGAAGQVGVVIVDYVRGDAAAGVFKLATTFGVVSGLFGTIVMLPLMPVAKEGLSKGTGVTELIKPIIRYLLMLGLPITAAGFVLAPEVITTFTRGGYESAVVPLRLLLTAGLLQMLMTATSGVLFVGTGLRALAKIYAAIAVASLIFGVTLTKRWGVDGMALAQLTAWIGGAILMCIWFWRNKPVHLEWKLYSRHALSAIIMATTVYFGVWFVPRPSQKLALGLCISVVVYLSLLWLQQDFSILGVVRALRSRTVS